MQASKDESHRAAFLKALDYYVENFFTSEGAPKWRAHKIYPNDVHGSAQGILTFAKASALSQRHLELARKIAQWAIRELQAPDEGYFYYQKFERFTWKLDLMRWGNSWMHWALAELLLAEARATK